MGVVGGGRREGEGVRSLVSPREEKGVGEGGTEREGARLPRAIVT